MTQGTSSHHSISKPWDGADNTYNKRMLSGCPVILMPTKILNKFGSQRFKELIMAD
jgi:hypothetical protein